MIDAVLNDLLGLTVSIVGTAGPGSPLTFMLVAGVGLGALAVHAGHTFAKHRQRRQEIIAVRNDINEIDPLKIDFHALLQSAYEKWRTDRSNNDPDVNIFINNSPNLHGLHNPFPPWLRRLCPKLDTILAQRANRQGLSKESKTRDDIWGFVFALYEDVDACVRLSRSPHYLSAEDSRKFHDLRWRIHRVWLNIAESVFTYKTIRFSQIKREMDADSTTIKVITYLSTALYFQITETKKGKDDLFKLMAQYSGMRRWWEWWLERLP